MSSVSVVITGSPLSEMTRVSISPVTVIESAGRSDNVSGSNCSLLGSGSCCVSPCACSRDDPKVNNRPRRIAVRFILLLFIHFVEHHDQPLQLLGRVKRDGDPSFPVLVAGELYIGTEIGR